MKREYWKTLVELIDLLGSKNIVALKNHDKSFVISTKYYDVSLDEKINYLCKKGGLKWDYASGSVTKGKRYKNEIPVCQYTFFEE